MKADSLQLIESDTSDARLEGYMMYFNSAAATYDHEWTLRVFVRLFTNDLDLVPRLIREDDLHVFEGFRLHFQLDDKPFRLFDPSTVGPRFTIEYLIRCLGCEYNPAEEGTLFDAFMAEETRQPWDLTSRMIMACICINLRHHLTEEGEESSALAAFYEATFDWEKEMSAPGEHRCFQELIGYIYTHIDWRVTECTGFMFPEFEHDMAFMWCIRVLRDSPNDFWYTRIIAKFLHHMLLVLLDDDYTDEDEFEEEEIYWFIVHLGECIEDIKDNTTRDLLMLSVDRCLTIFPTHAKDAIAKNGPIQSESRRPGVSMDFSDLGIAYFGQALTVMRNDMMPILPNAVKRRVTEFLK